MQSSEEIENAHTLGKAGIFVLEKRLTTTPNIQGKY